MARGTHRRRKGLLGSRAVGLASAIAGGLFIPYALTKGHATSVITAEGWRLAGLSATETALAIHVVEGIPLIVMAIGLISLHARTPGLGPLARTGVSVALAGYGLTVLVHLCEHLLPPFTVPVLTGSEDWLVWGYYLSWLVVFGGFALYGLALAIADSTPRWLPLLFVVGLPAATAIGITAAVLDVFTLAGVFRLSQGVTWLLVGNWLWQAPDAAAVTARSATAEP